MISHFSNNPRSRNLLLTYLLALCLLPFSAQGYDAWQDEARYTVTYHIDLSGLPEDATTVWIPLPAENPDQTVVSMQVNSPWPLEEIRDNRYNRVGVIRLPAGKRDVASATLVHRIVRKPGRGLAADNLSSADKPADYLSAQRMIPLQGMISDIATEVRANNQENPDLRRVYYDYVYDLMTYSKEGEGWGQGDAIWACQSKYGNCTDFHSLYIGLARSQGIAARFKIGFPLAADTDTGRHDGYHCWAEVWEDNHGWSPLDASEAKKAGLKDEYYGVIPSDRIEFTTGRDIRLSREQRGEPLNYFVYPYAESATAIIEKLPVKLTYIRDR
ncbi:MAG: transglutaminase domain-containing protein [Pseudomonadales bacterium]|nr:transglutaminase domain-containing protein [Pseudomonadales bacterium]